MSSWTCLHKVTSLKFLNHLKYSTSTMAHQKNIFVGRKVLVKPAMDILLNSGFNVSVYDKDGDPSEEEWMENVKGKHGIYCFGPQKITSKIIEAGDQLEIVSDMSVGVDAVDLEALKKKHIKLGHTPGVLTDAVADIAVGLVLCVSRRIVEHVDVARNGEWSAWEPFKDLGTGLRGSTVGIVGLGRIGLATGQRLAPFGVSKFMYTSRSEKKDAAAVLDAEYVSFDKLLSCSDYVIICCSMNESTKELFNTDAFSKMKTNAILVNIGRGGMINQDALVHALENNLIKGAGLDVTTPEPLPPTHPLYRLKNCVIIPHIGSAEEQTRTDMATLAARNLIAGLTGEQMPAQYPL